MEYTNANKGPTPIVCETETRGTLYCEQNNVTYVHDYPLPALARTFIDNIDSPH